MFLSKRNQPVSLGPFSKKADPKPFSVGDKVDVGEFFWIKDEDIIGWDQDARHHGYTGEKAHSSGSVDIGCVLTIRAIQNGYALVRLDRPETPYGAPAAIGTVFQVPLAQMEPWADKLEAHRTHNEQRKALASRYVK